MKNLNAVVVVKPKPQQKRSTSNRQALAVYIHESIVLQAPPKNQVFSELSNYIRDRQLTDALEFLERCGVTGSTAIFALKCLKRWGMSV